MIKYLPNQVTEIIFGIYDFIFETDTGDNMPAFQKQLLVVSGFSEGE